MSYPSLPPKLPIVALAFAAIAAAAPTPPAMAAVRHGRAHPAHHSGVASGRRAGVAQPPAGIERASRQMFLSIGEGEIINLPANAASVWTSNPAAADVYVNSPHQIHVFGQAFGESTIFATGASGAVIYSAHITVAQNSTSIDAMLRAAFPGTDIHVTVAGQVAVLTGTVDTPLDSSQAESYVKVALNPGIKLNGDDALRFLVINRLRTATPLQVTLRVRIAEVSRSLSRTLQSNLASANTASGFQYGIGQGRSILANNGTSSSLGVGVIPSGLGVTGATSTTVNGVTTTTSTVGQVQGSSLSTIANATTLAGRFAIGPFNILAALDAGEQAGMVTTLAEPNLTAESGETADFLAGGQFPIPISSGLGSVSIEFKNYGVSLSYTPTVLANGNISLRVRPEVSELDTTNAVSLNGFSVPGLTVRHAETTVELGSGQSFMIAGLLSNHANHAISKLPGAGDLPVLGALFKSTAFQKGETELVIIVTPYLVKPTDDANIKLPTDGLQTPNELKQLFGNMMTDSKSGAMRPGPTAAEPAQTPAVNTGDARDTPAGALPPPEPAGASTAVPAKSAAGNGSSGPGFSLN